MSKKSRVVKPRDSKEEIVEALLHVQVARENQGKKKAEEAIYRWVSKWTGHQVAVGQQFPIVRNGVKVGEQPQGLAWGLLGGKPIEVANLLASADKPNRDAVASELKAMKSFDKKLDAFLKALSGLSMVERARLEVASQFDHQERYQRPLESRLLNQIGFIDSAELAANELKRASTVRLEELAATHAGYKSGRGVARNEGAYCVALHLGKIYARTTGKRPTYSEDVSGLHGDFTPALREVFDALDRGWIDLSGPANFAKENISDDDLDTGLNLGLGVFPPCRND